MWITQLPGGMLAQKYGTKKVFGFSQFGSVLVAFLLPWSARTGAWGLIFMRCFQGLLNVSPLSIITQSYCIIFYFVATIFYIIYLLCCFKGFTWPAMHTMIAKWVPPDERSKFVSAYLGEFYYHDEISLYLDNT
jgi:MFS family permease